MTEHDRTAFDVFEPFTDTAFQDFLKVHQITSEGIKYILEARLGPSRNVAGTPYNQISDIPCPKMRGNTQAESATNEYPHTLLNIFDPQVLGYFDQPSTIGLCYQGRNRKTVRAPYTADSLVLHWQDGVILEEWKPASDKEKLEEKYPGKFQRLKDGSYISAPISEIIDPLGLKFRLRFSDEVTQIGHANRKFLFGYLQPLAATQYEPLLKDIINLFSESSCLSYQNLVDTGCEIDVLNWALATRHLHFDFDSALIEREPSKIKIFRHAQTLNAWEIAIRPDKSRPQIFDDSLTNRRLSAGDVLLFDGLRFTVHLAGATSVHAFDAARNSLQLTHEQIANAVRAGTLILPSPEGLRDHQSPFWRASPEGLARAVKKIEIIQQLERKEPIDLQDQYSDATYRRWRKEIRDGATKGWSPIESLIDQVANRGFHGTHIKPDLSEKINKWIQEKLENSLDPLISSIYREIEAMVEKEGERMLAMSSFYERVRQIKTLASVRKAKGHKHAYALKPSYWMLTVDTPIHGTRALETVHFDSTLLDIEIRSSLSGEVLGRPWLSLAQCANTRRVMGMYLSFRPPSQISSLMLLLDIVRRFGRLPESIVHDWGSEFKGKCWKHALTSLFITRHVRPKSAARFGAVLERMFGVVTRELLDNIAGNTKSRKNVRSLTPRSDPTNHSGLWLIDLARGLEEYFFNNYDNRKHPSTLMPPRASYEKSFIEHGLRPHQLRRLDDLLPILMPTATGKPRVIDPARGVFVNYRYYGHPELTKFALAGKTIEVKPLLFDPGSILAFLKGRWLICKSNISERFAKCSELVRQCIYEELRIEQRLVVKSDHLSRKKLYQLQESLNDQAIKNIEYWNAPQADDVLEITDVSSDTRHTKTSSSLSKLDQRMQLALSSMMTKQEATS